MVRIWNSLTRTKQALHLPSSSSSSLITLYVCGPTVYDSTHLGHGRTYTLFDAIRRVLRDVFHKQVIFAMNITDVDDKILTKAKESNLSPNDITKKYEKEFFSDMSILGNERPTITLRATEYIEEMKLLTINLCKLGYAYQTKDGSVYLDTVQAKNLVKYPTMLGLGMEEDIGRKKEDENKRHSTDFAIWKNDSTSLLNWEFEQIGGRGRPGWHLECSAMIDATLGRIRGDGCIDIHGGGIDLCFPHHANERAINMLHLLNNKSIKKEDEEFSRIFCHTGHVTIQDTKMSKSLGNFITIRGILETNQVTPRQLRLLFLSSSKYSSGLEWNNGVVDKVKSLDDLFEDCLSPSNRSSSIYHRREGLNEDDIGFIHKLAQAQDIILQALEDDFDFPKVFDELYKICKEIRRRRQSNNDCSVYLDKHAVDFVKSYLKIFGFESNNLSYEKQQQNIVVDEGKEGNVQTLLLNELVNFRMKVRNAAKSGDMKQVLKECDLLRDKNPFVSIQDLKDGTSLWKSKN